MITFLNVQCNNRNVGAIDAWLLLLFSIILCAVKPEHSTGFGVNFVLMCGRQQKTAPQALPPSPVIYTTLLFGRLVSVKCGNTATFTQCKGWSSQAKTSDIHHTRVVGDSLRSYVNTIET